MPLPRNPFSSSLPGVLPLVRGGEEDLGRSRGGLTTKIHVLVDERGRPLCYLLTPGQAADCRHAETLLEGVSFASLLGDRAYDTDALRAWCAEHGVEAVIPSKRNREGFRLA
jgi:IS5 family transposase